LIRLAAILLVLSSSTFAQTGPLAVRIQQCAGCHGDDGNSKTKNIPSLAGQPEFFILNQLFLMREGVRKLDAMRFVKDLQDEEITQLAKHFAAIEPRASDESTDPELGRRGSELAVKGRCASCHLTNMVGQQQIPRLARQRLDYLVLSMKELRDSKRPWANTLMSNAVAGLSDDDLTALAHYVTTR
jgi:cytochrome c553